MKFRFASLYSTHLDLNGDQANLEVAKKRLEWAGHTVEVVNVGKQQDLPSDVDFIFLGHGSLAAWNDISPSLVDLVPQVIDAIKGGSGFMAVATGHEKAIELGLIEGSVSPTERVSKFEIVDFEGQEVLGYLNSATSAPVFQKEGLVIGTQLHGPVFAKNPLLVDQYFSELSLLRKNTELGDIRLNNNAGLVAGIVEQVWMLERELASE